MPRHAKAASQKAVTLLSKVTKTAIPRGEELLGSEERKREAAKSKRVGTKRKPARGKRETSKLAPAEAAVKSAKKVFRKILSVADPEATKTVSPVEIKF